MAETEDAMAMEKKETERVVETVPEEESGATMVGLRQKVAAMQA